MNNRVTPDFVESLKENEIFVFGSRNSGRHYDGASAYALRHFGAVMGQREGRQGQSYAIPTVGGNIGIRDIRMSVKQFTEYAKQYRDLTFLVTAIGCGGGGWSPRYIAPLFFKASKLPNVYLPEEFWEELERYPIGVYRDRLKIFRHNLSIRINRKIRNALRWMCGLLPDKLLYKVLNTPLFARLLDYRQYDLNEGMASVCPAITLKPQYEVYLLDHNSQRAYMLRDNKGRFMISDADIDWNSTAGLPPKVMQRINERVTPFYSSGVLCPGFQNGVACVFWTVSPDGKTYYLDKWSNGPQTDEKDVTLYGLINKQCKFVRKMQVVPIEKRDAFMAKHNIRQEI